MALSEDRKILLAFLTIVALSIFFRFYHLDSVPKWDFDEGYNMRYAYDLLEGKILWFSIKYTFLPHPPLFFMAYALVIKFLGVGVPTLRFLVAFYGVATTIVLYYAGREMFNPKVGLLASFIYAATPEVVFWNRIGFANNQFIFLSAVSLYFIHMYSKTSREGHLYLACFFTGLVIITEYTGLMNLAAIVVYMLIYHRKSTLKAVVVSLIPVLLLFVFMLYYSPEYFLFDLNYQFGRFLSIKKIAFALLSIFLLLKLRKRISDFYKPLAEALNQDIIVYIVLLSLVAFTTSEESYFWNATTYMLAMCIFGLCFIPSFLIEQERERRLLVLFIVFNILYLLAVDRADHMPMVLYPFISIALAAMLYATYSGTLSNPPWVFKKFKINLPEKIVFALSFYAVFVSMGFTAYFFLLSNISQESIDKDLAAADFVNQRASEGDLVLTYSWMFPMLKKVRVSLLTQSLAYEGIPIAYYSGDFPKERFEFNTSYIKARFLISDNNTYDWILNKTNRIGPAEYLKNWSREEVAGFFIYQNPAYSVQ